MIHPSALNVLIIGFSVVIFQAIWRLIAIRYSDTSWGQAMAVIV